MTRRLTIPTAIIGILVLYSLVNPLRTEHYAMLGAAAGFWLVSRPTRHFILAFSPFILFTWMYDLLRIFSEFATERVIIQGFHQLELKLFGWTTASGERLSPNEVLAFLHNDILDVIGGVWYASHVGVIILLGVLLWWNQFRTGEKGEASGQLLHRFLWGFLVLNMGMFVLNILMPVAPPWYITNYGYALPSPDLMGDPAGLARLDALFGIEYFSTVYQKSSYVFGAFPSGHTAYAVWFALHTRGTKWRTFGWVYAGVIRFYAVYLNHHYILDLMGGTTLAVSVYLLFRSTRLSHLPCAAQGFLSKLFDERTMVVEELRKDMAK